ncbi:transcription antitermination factor NusB [Oenococcus sp. UCMA 16435]|nr:transcription antitermination factor NusB [Oenococcus sp. UCMA 16435]MDI4584848.1 transcription antitermination factor NusB [Oenococcus sp. UCMA 14587]MDN6967579.1 transcription antitermination factor NusB [Oenococcus sp. UCMA 17063]
MSLSRQQIRELGFQAIFALEINSDQDKALLKKTLFEQNTIDDYFNELVDGVFAVHKELEEKYKPYLKDNWSLERISKTADIAMQIGIFELTKRIDIPKKVSLDQATELAKNFGDESDGKFVNGVLAHFVS